MTGSTSTRICIARNSFVSLSRRRCGMKARPNRPNGSGRRRAERLLTCQSRSKRCRRCQFNRRRFSRSRSFFHRRHNPRFSPRKRLLLLRRFATSQHLLHSSSSNRSSKSFRCASRRRLHLRNHKRTTCKLWRKRSSRHRSIAWHNRLRNSTSRLRRIMPKLRWRMLHHHRHHHRRFSRSSRITTRSGIDRSDSLQTLVC